MKKLIISYYKSEDENYKFVLNAKIFFGFAVLVLAPYIIIVSMVLNGKNPHTPSAPIVVVQKKIEVPNKIDLIKVSQSSIEHNKEFKILEFNHSTISNGLNIKFLLSKNKSDNLVKSGSIKIVALNENGNKVAESENSIFKFQYSRISNFELKNLDSSKVAKIKVMINSETSKSEESYIIPLK